MTYDPRLRPHQLNPLDSAGDPVLDGGYLFDVADGKIVGLIPNTGLIDPTTTKGDLIVNDGSGVDRIGVGSNGQVLTTDSTTAEGVKWATPGGGGVGGGGPSSYAQTNKTFTIARNTSSGSTWMYMSWLVTHYQWLRILSFACDILQTDTYTLSIDGHDVASAASTGASAPFALTLTLGTPEVLEPGPHLFRLRATAARTFYYNNSNAPTPTGTYVSNLQVTPWLETATTAPTNVHGTLTFDAEGS